MSYHRRTRSERSTYELLLVDVAAALGISAKLARSVLGEFIARLPDAVWGKGRVVIPGLGSFRVRARRPRRISNPVNHTELMTLPATRLVACRVSKHWRRR